LRRSLFLCCAPILFRDLLRWSFVASFLWMEVSDLIDGKVARSSKQVSNFGKLFDPFADIISRSTYFVAFASVAITPLWVLVIVLYREFSILFCARCSR